MINKDYINDEDIAKTAVMVPINEIAATAGLCEDDLECYGKYKAKVDLKSIGRFSDKPDGKLILVTAINPTPAGEGKTTISIGLADALRLLGKHTILALREPSLGPVFGMKGGATGGGYSQVLPSEDINLHFTGDLHAVSAANNLLAAIIDNHLYRGNALGIDPRQITWKRCADINDRQLRFIVSGLSGKANGIPREDGYDITAASETMAILCLSKDISHLKENLKRITVGYTYKGVPVTAGDLNAHGAMAVLLRDALKPNLAQTIGRTPAFIHGGPFANIAHGCNSVIATKLALKLADYVVTEAGFGADLGAEKFCDIKCRIGGIKPSACVIVATVRALKHHGGARSSSLAKEDLDKLRLGTPNLFRHYKNMQDIYHIPAVVAINRFPGDAPAEIELLQKICANSGVTAILTEVWAKGGKGGIGLAEAAAGLAEASTAGNAQASTVENTQASAVGPAEAAAGLAEASTAGNAQASVVGPAEASTAGNAQASVSGLAEASTDKVSSPFDYAYSLNIPILEKIQVLARSIYGADGAIIMPAAKKEAAKLEKLGYGNLPVCIAKTQYSFSDDPQKIGAPSGFNITIRSLKALTGAGFIVAHAGDIMTMPGLPKSPAAERISVTDDGAITGIF